MADLKISELSALAGSNLVAADELAIVDDSASETKKITVSDLIANGVTVISDDTIPGAKILFAAGDIATAALADSAVTTAKVNNGAITAAKLANESTVDLVTTLPTSGAFTGQLAVDTDDNSIYCWNGSAWLSLKAPDSVGTISGSTTGEINIVTAVSGTTVTISATLDNTTSAAQFLAGPTGSAGAVSYRTVVGSDLPTATTTAKGGVVVNGNGLVMDGDTIEISNAVTASGTHHVVTYDANGLITGGRVLASSDLPVATSSARGAIIPSDGLTVDVNGNLSVNNSVTADTYTKVTVTAQGLVSSGTTLLASDIPDHSAAKLTSGTIPSSILSTGAVTATKLADSSTMKFGGALGSDNVTIFPDGDFKGQLFWDETSLDLYLYSGSSFVPITVLSGNLVNAGTYNANTNLVSSVTTAGSSVGFTAGSALPAPIGANLNHYVVVDTSGTGSGAAPAVALAPPDMLLSNGVGAEYRLIDVSNAIAGQTASNISFIASGNIAATNVQTALQELDAEKLQAAGGNISGNINLAAGVNIVYEGSTANEYETTLSVTDPTADRAIVFPNVSGNVVTTGDTGTVTSAMLTDGTIVNADINASAEIAVSKLANGSARQLLQTDSGGTGVEFTSNVDVPGTLDVAGAATLDSTLSVSGDVVIFNSSAASKLWIKNGNSASTANNAVLNFGNTEGTGQIAYSDFANKTMTFTVDGYEIMRLKDFNTTAGSSNIDHRVGIGESLPQAMLDVKDGAIFVNRSTIGNSDPRIKLEKVVTDVAGTDVITGKITADNLVSHDDILWTKNNNADTSGRIGNAPYIHNGGTDGDLAIQSTNGNITFVTSGGGGVEMMRIDNTGKVGIGASNNSSYDSIAQNLLVADESGNTGITIRSGGSTPFGAIHFADGTSSNAEKRAGRIIYQHAIDTLSFSTADAEAMRLDSSGNLLIGGTTAATADIALNANGSATIKNDISLERATAPSNVKISGSDTHAVWLSDGKFALKYDGSATFTGAVSKGSGSFKISHPLPAKTETHHLVHSFIEGPQADLIYRGYVDLVDGQATVNIDTAGRMTEGTFEVLCVNVSCFTSNESDWAAVKGSVTGNVLTITAQDATATSKVSWMVVGERKDQHMLETDWTDDAGRVITEPEKVIKMAEESEN